MKLYQIMRQCQNFDRQLKPTERWRSGEGGLQEEEQEEEEQEQEEEEKEIQEFFKVEEK